MSDPPAFIVRYLLVDREDWAKDQGPRLGCGKVIRRRDHIPYSVCYEHRGDHNEAKKEAIDHALRRGFSVLRERFYADGTYLYELILAGPPVSKPRGK